MKSPRVNVSSRVNVSRVTLIQKCLDGTLTRCTTAWMSSTCLSKSFSLIRFSVFLFGWTTCFIFTPRYRDHVDSRTFTFTFYFPFSFLFIFIFTASFILFCAKAILNDSSQVDSDTTTTTTMSKTTECHRCVTNFQCLNIHESHIHINNIYRRVEKNLDRSVPLGWLLFLPVNIVVFVLVLLDSQSSNKS